VSTQINTSMYSEVSTHAFEPKGGIDSSAWADKK